MKTKKLFPLFLIMMSMTLLFSSCDKLKEVTIKERKSIKINVETVVKEGAATYASLSLRAGEVNTFSGTANVRLSDIPELNSFDLSNLSSGSIRNITIVTACTEPGDFYVENINLQTTGASAIVNRVVIGETVSNNNDVNTFAQALITNLISGNVVPITISGTTNVNPPGKIITYIMNLDVDWVFNL